MATMCDDVSTIRKCDEGHQWTVSPGDWYEGCLKCSNQLYLTARLREACKLAARRGGECLSAKFESDRAQMIWRCDQGHEWFASLNVVGTGAWCKICNKKWYWDGYFQLANEIAARRGGKLLSDKFKDKKVLLTWECAEGHELSLSFSKVYNGGWCNICIKQSIHRDVLERARKTVFPWGGACLSTERDYDDDLLKWRCVKNHEWSADYDDVSRLSIWCPVCREEIISARVTATGMGGRCLSTEYDNTGTSLLLWKCDKNHEWSADYDDVRLGIWCPTCAKA